MDNPFLLSSGVFFLLLYVYITWLSDEVSRPALGPTLLLVQVLELVNVKKKQLAPSDECRNVCICTPILLQVFIVRCLFKHSINLTFEYTGCILQQHN
jgi:hypothetical protein